MCVLGHVCMSHYHGKHGVHWSLFKTTTCGYVIIDLYREVAALQRCVHRLQWFSAIWPGRLAVL